MRSSLLVPILILGAPLLAACTSTTHAAQPADGSLPVDAGSDAAESESSDDNANPGFVVLEAGVQLPTEACDDSADGGCLSGTLSVTGDDGGQAASGGAWAAAPGPWTVALYRTFPSTGIAPIAIQVAAKDATWAFSGLSEWSHYYVEFVPSFKNDAGIAEGAATRAGPLSVPPAATPVAIQGKPVQLDVFEEGATGGAMEKVESAAGRIVETAAGSSTVSLTIGGTTTAIPWTSAAGQASLYYLQLSPSPAAQPTYTVTTQAPGKALATWTLAADATAFTGTITSPAVGATVPAAASLAVSWTVQPDPDYQVVALFQQVQGSWTRTYTSAQADTADVRQETIPAANLMSPGPYLLNVVFTRANCPTTADGCVHASAAVTEQIMVE